MGTSIVLHKVHLGLELSEAQAKDFNDFRKQVLIVSFQPPPVIDWTPEILSKKKWCQDERDKWLTMYENIITENQYGVFLSGLSANELRVVSTTLLDSLLLAGGTSVPSVLSNGLAVLYSDNSPLSEDRDWLKEPEDIQKLVWEVIRSMPKVLGFTWWNRGGTERQGVALSMALRDPKVWGSDSDSFRLRELSEYEAYGSVAWAQPANGPGWRDGALSSASRGCPGQKLSFMIATEFFKMWSLLQKDWKVQQSASGLVGGPGNITFSNAGPSWTSSFELINS